MQMKERWLELQTETGTERPREGGWSVQDWGAMPGMPARLVAGKDLHTAHCFASRPVSDGSGRFDICHSCFGYLSVDSYSDCRSSYPESSPRAVPRPAQSISPPAVSSQSQASPASSQLVVLGPGSCSYYYAHIITVDASRRCRQGHSAFVVPATPLVSHDDRWQDESAGD
jgi:hypothetical protein